MTAASREQTITVVVVLYKTSPRMSIALTSLANSLGSHAERFTVEVHDNSPHPSRDRLVPGLTLNADIHHPDNPGLAVPYNLALEAAKSRGSQWLLFLDQDTRVTSQYIDEVVTFVTSAASTPHIAIGVPQLYDERGIISPHKPLRLVIHPLKSGRTYSHSFRYAYLNSGAVIRVTAARAVGGFPVEYPLDFLDHAMSARLKNAGYSLFALESRLKHQLSVRDMTSVPATRLLSIFRAEEQYYARTSRHEATWLLIRRGARALLLLLRIHRSTYRQEEFEAARRAVWAVIAPRPRNEVAISALGAPNTTGHRRPKSSGQPS